MFELGLLLLDSVWGSRPLIGGAEQVGKICAVQRIHFGPYQHLSSRAINSNLLCLDQVITRLGMAGI